MKTITKVGAALLAVFGAVMQVPQVQTWAVHFFAAHPGLSAAVGTVAALAGVLHDPKKQ